MLTVQLLAGFALLLAGGEALVRGSSALAARAGISPLLIGITLVGFGTSMPELVTSVQAALAGSPGIALGNIVGSNIANVLLILGLAALLAPIVTSRNSVYRDGFAVAGSALLFSAIAVVTTFSRPVGIVLVIGLFAYMYLAWRTERGASEAAEPAPQVTGLPGTGMCVAMTLGGLVTIILGGRFLVQGAIELATMFGISQAVIGLTIVAVGTSLPELVTSVLAARRGESEIALGNVLGSNVYNLLGIGGFTALVAPVAMPPEMLGFDIPVLIGTSFLLVFFIWTGMRVTRLEGGAFLACYGAYLFFLWP